MNSLYCFIGKSGSGKTTLCEYLNMRLGLKPLKSYTTKEKRKPTDDDHIYISVKEYLDLPDKLCTTYFDGNYYCATKEQIEEADLYVIDLKGYKELKKTYKGDKKIVPIYLDVPMEIVLERMILRGDSEDKAWGRLRHDWIAFRGVENVDGIKKIDGRKTLEELERDLKILLFFDDIYDCMD